MMRIDPIALASRIPNERLRLRALDRLLAIFIPFNRGLGFQIAKLTPEEVIVTCKDSKRRTNHVGSAHAGLLATMGEYPAGLLISQQYPVSEYRLVLGKLEIEYFKRGQGLLTATARSSHKRAPAETGEIWVEMLSEIHNENKELIARCQTRWQVKAWSKTSY